MERYVAKRNLFLAHSPEKSERGRPASLNDCLHDRPSTTPIAIGTACRDHLHEAGGHAAAGVGCPPRPRPPARGVPGATCPTPEVPGPCGAPGCAPPGDPGVVAMPGVCPTPGLQGASHSKGLPDPGAQRPWSMPGVARPLSRPVVVGHLTSAEGICVFTAF